MARGVRPHDANRSGRSRPQRADLVDLPYGTDRDQEGDPAARAARASARGGPRSLTPREAQSRGRSRNLYGRGVSDRTEPRGHRVVVVGGGFGGVQAVRKLHRAPVEITLVDRRNFSLFQPLVYQVATGSLSPGEIAVPLRSIFKRAGNVHVVLGEVTDFDLERRRVVVDGTAEEGR